MKTSTSQGSVDRTAENFELNGMPERAERGETFLDLFGHTDEDLQFAENLEQLLIGQPKAKKMLHRVNRAARNKLRDKTRPIFKAILVGKSHVGKTETARALAQLYHNDPDAFVRINCETFIDRSDLTRLIGAGPRWVGYDDPKNRKGKGEEQEYNPSALLSRVNLDLSKKGSKKDVVIILFDEIEKAEAEEFSLLLLKILDTGKLQLANNVEVDFSDCIILMTSNEGMRDFEEKKRKNPFGFGLAQNAVEPGELADHVDAAIRKRYAPEWLNRIDEIVLYDELTSDQMLQVVDLEVRRLEQRIQRTLGSKAFHLDVDATARLWIRNKAQSLKGDAAELKRLFPRNLSDPLGEGVNRGEIRRGDEIHVEVSKDLEQLTFRRVRYGQPEEDAGPDVAQERIWPQHLQESYDLIQRGADAKKAKNVREAERLLNAAIAMLDPKIEEDIPMLAGAMNQKAHLDYEKKNYGQAGSLYMEALRLRQSTMTQENWLDYLPIGYLFGNSILSMQKAGATEEARELWGLARDFVRYFYVGEGDVSSVASMLESVSEALPDESYAIMKFALSLGVPAPTKS